MAGHVPARAADPREESRHLEELLGSLTRTFERGHPDSVVVRLEAMDGHPPLTARLWNLLGLSHAALGRTDEAIADYESGIRIAPRRAELHVNLAVTLVETGRTGRAMAEFEEGVRLAPENVDARLGYGRLLTRFRRWGPAREELETARRLAPDDPRVLTAWAELVERSSGPQEAASAWEVVEAVQPTARSARKLGELAAARKDSSAVTWFERCLDRDAQALDCREAAGRLLLLAGEAQRCRHLLQPVAGELSDAGYHNLLLALAALGDVEALVEQCHRRPPARADSWGVLAGALRDAGRLQEGLEAVRSGRRIDEGDDALANLQAAILWDLGRHDEARQLWRRILQRSPEDATARANLQNSGGG
jgi:tetratricopeptide (TPR) repeat protein